MQVLRRKKKAAARGTELAKSSSISDLNNAKLVGDKHLKGATKLDYVTTLVAIAFVRFPTLKRRKDLGANLGNFRGWFCI